MTETPVDPQRVRQAVIAALPGDYSVNAARLADLYTPQAHVRALRLDAALVVGGRGTGKTFWTSALHDEEIRGSLGSLNHDLSRTDVKVGYAEVPDSGSYPDSMTFTRLLEQGVEAFDVWRTVVHGLVAGSETRLPVDREEDWATRVDRARREPEKLSRDVEDAQRRFADAGRHALVVFDALDRIAVNWNTADDVARNLLRTALWIRPFRNLHAKVFLREDQYARTIHDFPDASKLRSTEARLTWGREDLHGLLWTRLINGPGDDGAVLRRLGEASMNGAEFRLESGVWRVANRGEKTLRALFSTLAGTKMGTNERRGNPYTWIISHLADGTGATSPRSLLRALDEAARDSLERYGDSGFPHPLHYESIKRGVVAASQGRVSELSEDYPWVEPLVQVLEGGMVPMDESAVVEAFGTGHPDGPVVRDRASTMGSLPPEHEADGWPGIIEDLIRIGVLTRRADGRIDMPDLYRLGFKVRRKGGVVPQK